MSDEEFGPDFKPTPAQQANADQRHASARNSVDRLIGKAMRGELGDEYPSWVAVALLAADEVSELASTDEDMLPAALALVAEAVGRAVHAENELAHLASRKDTQA